MPANKSEIWSKSSCYSFEVLDNYVAGKLPKEASHAIESHLVDCDVCSDVVEGLQAMPHNHDVKKEILAINREIDKKILHKRNRNVLGISTYSLRFAAAAVLVTFAVCVVIFMNYDSKQALYKPSDLSKNSLSKNKEQSDDKLRSETSANEELAQNIPGQKIDAPIKEAEPYPASASESRNYAEPEEKTVFDELFNIDEDDHDASGSGDASEEHSIADSNNKQVNGNAGGFAYSDNTTATGKTQEKQHQRQESSALDKKDSDRESAPPSATHDLVVVESDALIMEEPISDYFSVEVKPEYPGGEAAMLKFISDNIAYPIVAKENRIQPKNTVFPDFILIPVLDLSMLTMSKLSQSWLKKGFDN